jgi:hypothetical protein
MMETTALENNTVAYEKARLIHEAHQSLLAAHGIDERVDLNEASFIEWYDRTIPEVRDIKILAGAMEVELARRRGERIKSEGERRGGSRQTDQPVSLLSVAVQKQRSRALAIASQPEAVTAYVQGETKAKRVPSVRGAAEAANLAKPRLMPRHKVKGFEAGQTRTNHFDIEIIDALDRLADGVRRSDPQIMKMASVTESRRFLRYVRLIPWLTIDRTVEGTVFIIDQELREICEGKRSRPELEIKSIFRFLQDLRAEITSRRKKNSDERQNSRWNPLPIDKRQQSVLLDYIEEQLDRVPTL